MLQSFSNIVYSSSSSERSLKFPASGSARERAGTENGLLILVTGLRFMAGVGTCMDKDDDATKSWSNVSFGEAYPLPADTTRACPNTIDDYKQVKRVKI
jgi:hypothetical protein